ncbi:MAG: squalene/phytoene synthase family protein [Mycobacteriaceae bacterium]|uniref:squalene/phytoene synthase family protein n=1 Tax=Corynebacterium sp. TaxID=1720 RepID=UPI00264B2324|nr:squalene/phytoene synthase family protein [Corynebacterium sp.]
MKNWRVPRQGGKYSDPYPALADRVAADVIGHYSTSFTLATRLLAPDVRRDIRNLYAVVRIADEIVDGAASGAGEDAATVREILEGYARAVTDSPSTGFHTDPVLHAFAGTARRCGLDMDHMHAFFSSMRADLDPVVHDGGSLAEYIHGSAEVIGLMCLDIFLTHGATTADRVWLQDGAVALGSAFQKINFLRDMGEDTTVLHRAYLPGSDGSLDDRTKDRLLDDAAAELEAARARIPGLPRGARAGVAAATALYGELVDRLRATPATRLTGPDARRVSVPAPVKALVTARAVLR